MKETSINLEINERNLESTKLKSGKLAASSRAEKKQPLYNLKFYKLYTKPPKKYGPCHSKLRLDIFHNLKYVK